MSRNLCLAGALVFSSAALAQSVPVTVVNPSTNPVRTTVQGPVQVTGSVEVSSLPPVTISGTPSVTVTNQPGQGTIYSESFPLISTGATGGSTLGAAGSTVPAGKRRIINTVSAVWTCDSGKRLQLDLILNRSAGALGILYVPGQFTYTLSGRDTYVGSMAVNVAIPPGGSAQPNVETDFNSNCVVELFLFGVEVPDAP
jgi:hypothetical protein